ncbi:fused nickel transport protein NikMN [Clostridium homopropionicum DSM 5847]|uniref:Fused nickel transport protein NikMN n=1 Tax=Clostridium homopropionicum DSM 5847 TaxID=1121318 RepID=A0A0L6ZF51_9CLOT|nr:cobalt transporter CbiM [Clostridium homopropionicum]KOA21408.1 fused nickel transport protein NikMN [Clostridium homopropionicum DSM 5847]SFG10854.1 cobalt/nickel transport system permease protein [Clostridium homopropionicum]
MHIPDNFLSPTTCAVIGTTMLPIWKRAAAKVKKEMSRKKMPLLGICAAFSFLIMMFNLPLPGGTTGHAVGATLIAILVGPYGATIAVTIALAIQALFFGDGGVLALGANSFNMAFVMPFTGYYIYNLISSRIKGEKGKYLAAFIAAYISLNFAALFTAIEFGIQPLLFKDSVGNPIYCPYGLNVSIPAMMIPHLLLAGFIEGAFTAGILAYIKKLSPSIIEENIKENNKPIYVLLIFMIILVPIGLLASGTAWGEWGITEIKERIGFIPQGMKEGFDFRSLIPEYYVSGIPEILGYIISAVIGVILIFISVKLIVTIKNKRA